jgi:hypothetical protein
MQAVLDLQPTLAHYRQRLAQHPVYPALNSLEDLQVFMQHHIFAVWDFMSLLKSLQQHLTCTQVPWLPPQDTAAARFINEIVLGEETDEAPQGGYTSHFELYLQAMHECGADTAPIRHLLHLLSQGVALPQALQTASPYPGVTAFVSTTWEILQSGSLPAIAAAFTLGGEAVIPDMFQALVRDLETRFPERFVTLRYYLDRHIHLDGDHHGPLAFRLLETLCSNSPAAWAEVETTTQRVLEARLTLWDSVCAALKASRP